MTECETQFHISDNIRYDQLHFMLLNLQLTSNIALNWEAHERCQITHVIMVDADGLMYIGNREPIQYKDNVLSVQEIPLERSHDCIISRKDLPILVRQHFYIETGPRPSANIMLSSLCLHCQMSHITHIDGLVQERRNSIADALELCLSCTNPSICNVHITLQPSNLWLNTKLQYLHCKHTGVTAVLR